MFMDLIMKYGNNNGHVFKAFFDIVDHFNDVLLMVWVLDYIAFWFYEHTYMVHKHN